MTVRFADAADVAALGPTAAVQAIVDALRDGIDPATDPPRVAVSLPQGQLMLMPSHAAAAAGVKVVTIAPHNPERGLPRIQAAYLLFDSDTLELTAVLDGTALTTLRTPAVSVAAVRGHLPAHPLRVAVFGSGPQAVGHALTLGAVHAVETVTYVVRDPSRTPLDAVAVGSPQAAAALGAADVVICATSARSPLFDSNQLRPEAVVVAVGSHEPDARELEAALLGRSTVVVEDVPTALREAGDVIMAVSAGELDPERLVTMRALVTGAAEIPAGRPLVFKSVGMAWEDLVVAAAVLRHCDATVS